MINIENLYKSFGKKEVLRGISISFNDPGSVTAVLGPNGSGKTTLIKSILGMVLPSKGSITLNGSNIKGQHQYRQGIDYLPQIAQFPENLTVREIIRFMSTIRNSDPEPESLIKLYGLEHELDQKLGTLSGGTKQKVNLVISLMYNNSLVIMDEPTSGLDPVALQTLKNQILNMKKEEKTIVITSHIMDFVEEMADRIIFLLDGNIYYDGPTSQLMNQQHTNSLEKAIASILGGSQKAELNGSLQQSNIPLTSLNELPC